MKNVIKKMDNINKKTKKLNKKVNLIIFLFILVLALVIAYYLSLNKVKKDVDEIIKYNQNIHQEVKTINKKVDGINISYQNKKAKQRSVKSNGGYKPYVDSGDTNLIVYKYCKKYNVEPALVKAIIHVESKGNHNVRSKSGAIGIMQLTPSTAKAFGVNPYNKEDNIHGGIKYLSYLNKKFDNDTHKVIASYNAGETAVKKYNGVPPYKETQLYVTKVLKIKEQI